MLCSWLRALQARETSDAPSTRTKPGAPEAMAWNKSIAGFCCPFVFALSSYALTQSEKSNLRRGQLGIKTASGNSVVAAREMEVCWLGSTPDCQDLPEGLERFHRSLAQGLFQAYSALRQQSVHFSTPCRLGLVMYGQSPAACWRSATCDA
jgi:hypothetical protein